MGSTSGRCWRAGLQARDKIRRLSALLQRRGPAWCWDTPYNTGVTWNIHHVLHANIARPVWLPSTFSSAPSRQAVHDSTHKLRIHIYLCPDVFLMGVLSGTCTAVLVVVVVVGGGVGGWGGGGGWGGMLSKSANQLATHIAGQVALVVALVEATTGRGCWQMAPHRQRGGCLCRSRGTSRTCGSMGAAVTAMVLDAMDSLSEGHSILGHLTMNSCKASRG